MKRKVLFCLMLLLSIVSLSFFVLRSLPVIKNNREVKKVWNIILTNGNIRPFSQYKDRVPLDKMDINALLKASESVVMGGDESQYYDFSWTLTKDIHYYSKKLGLKVLTKTLPAGTVVQLTNNGSSMFRINGYGIFTFPTYQRGWRYGRCLLTKEEADNITIEETGEAPYYYVKTSEIEDLAREYIQVSLDKGMGSVADGMTMDEYKEKVFSKTVYPIDNVLYAFGVYDSPNLYKTVFDTGNVLLLSGSVLFVIIGTLFLFLKRKNPIPI